MRNEVDSNQRCYRSLLLAAVATASLSMALGMTTLTPPNVFGGAIDERCNYTIVPYSSVTGACQCPGGGNTVPFDSCELSRPMSEVDSGIPLLYCEPFESMTCDFTFTNGPDGPALDCGVVYVCDHLCDDDLPPWVQRNCQPSNIVKPPCVGSRGTCGIDPWSM